MGVVGTDLSPHLVAIGLRFAMQVLIARAAWTRSHGTHPEMIGVGADRVDGLFETDLDLETDAEEFDDL